MYIFALFTFLGIGSGKRSTEVSGLALSVEVHVH
jgi:hypothetical protein